MIEVVAAVIIRDGRILLAQRPLTTSFGGRWCSAGGKVEPGESGKDALRRELKEEHWLLEVEIGEIVAQWVGGPPTLPRPMRVTFYVVAIRDNPRLGEFMGLGWFTAKQMRVLAIEGALVPANDMMSQDIADYMARAATVGA